MLKILNKFNILKKNQQAQRGAVLMVMLVILIVGGSALLLNSLSSTALKTERDKITADALLQAKEALIGFSASVDLSGSGSSRPGDLPCPDTDNDGVSGGFSIFSCNLQSQRVGRLPWKTLGLTDLRDSSGERLWYAVSSNFKNSTRTPCTSPGQPGCLNSDSLGTITIRSSDGTIINDASISNGVVAVVIAPGAVLQRTDQGTAQDRSSTGINNLINYLDIAPGFEDNADFTDSTTNGFVQGIVKDNSSKIILNDQLLVITQDNIMQVIQKRVAGEVKQCLKEYAADIQNKNRYPWAATLTSYPDTSSQLFGRIPDTPFTSTYNDSGAATGGMLNTWVGNCNILSGAGWWLNWKDMLFYGVASAYKPSNPPSVPTICSVTTPCYTLNPPSVLADKKFVVVVAGKALPTQLPRVTNDLTKYLEGGNQLADQTGGFTFIQSAPSASFNDTAVFQ